MRRIRRFFASLVFLLVVVFGLSYGASLAGWFPWSFTESARIDRGTFFRLKVDLSYRGTPQHFDIVAGCNTLDIGYKDGSSTREVGLVPTVYGRRMADSKGLVVRVPDACNGETTANGQVPANFLPVMVVYDDADTLGFGTAYMADEAYDSPRSALRFGKATIEPATRAEFEAFRRDGPPNLVTRDQYLKTVYPGFGRSCWSYARSLVPEGKRAEVRRYWPADRPRYWVIPDYKQAAQLGDVFPYFAPYKFPRDDGRFEGDMQMRVPDAGAYRRDGVASIGRKPFLKYALALYPASTSIAAHLFPADPARWPDYVAGLKTVDIMRVDVADTANRGFAYCSAGIPFRYPQDGDLSKQTESRPGLVMIDGEPVANAPVRWLTSVSDVMTIFEKDRFVFDFQQFYLESMRGDV